MSDHPSSPTAEALMGSDAGRRSTLVRILALSLAILITLVMLPIPPAAAHGADDEQCMDEDHHGEDSDHHHIPKADGTWDCSDDELLIKDSEAGSEYITRLLRSELGGYVERFARWAAVALLLYSVVWMIWPLFQSSRGGGGEQRKVFKNLVLPLIVAAIAFDLSITGTIFDFFIGLVDAAGSTFSDLF